MKEKPIIFNTAMVNAILDGRKTQTRRVVKFPDGLSPNRAIKDTGFGDGEYLKVLQDSDATIHRVRCALGYAGNQLWVRETFSPSGDGYGYKADLHEIDASGWGWTPSIFMPRKASRIQLRIKDVRVERVQDISKEDAIAEGFPRCKPRLSNTHAITWFKCLWNTINEKRGFGWDVNPWVWVIKFERIEK